MRYLHADTRLSLSLVPPLGKMPRAKLFPTTSTKGRETEKHTEGSAPQKAYWLWSTLFIPWWCTYCEKKDVLILQIALAKMASFANSKPSVVASLYASGGSQGRGAARRPAATIFFRSAKSPARKIALLHALAVKLTLKIRKDQG